MSSSDHPFYAPGLRIPRFLFRGFNAYSGSGLSVNEFGGIIPHGFVVGYDTEIELGKNIEPWRVQWRVQMHVRQQNSPPTPFSSWSHDWITALPFACTRWSKRTKKRVLLRDEDCGFIAVLDTWAFGDENMLRNRIFHVPQFRIPEPDLKIHCEWLIWGPISGPAYRCASVSAIREAINCPKWPRTLTLKQEHPYLLRKDVRDSLLIAQCFEKSDDGSSDVMLAVAAAELATRMWGAPFQIAPDRDLETNPVRPLWPPEMLERLLDMFALCRPVLSGRPLVHGWTAVGGFPRVQLMYTLLRKAEARWRDSDPGTPWGPVDWNQILLDYIPQEEGSPSSCLERQEDHK